MSISYAVKVWELQTRYRTNKNGKRVVGRYVVRWMVDNERFDRSYKIRAQADSFRSDLLSAARKGEAFDCVEGLPLSMLQQAVASMEWLEFACKFIDMKWGSSSPKHRSSIADSLVAATLAILPDDPARPDTRLLSKSLRRVLNRHQREDEQPAPMVDAIRWAKKKSSAVGDLAKPDVLRDVLDRMERRQDGKRAAYDTIRLRRTHFRSALDYAVELKLLTANPLPDLKIKRQKSTVLRQVDKRTVPNPKQARRFLAAVNEFAPRLTAFFGLMYFAGLRPEEAANLRKSNLAIPAQGEGEIYLEKANPEVGAVWTDSRVASEERGLKHREDDIGRTVPCPEELTELLHEHLNTFGMAPDGRLFRGERDGGRLGSTVYGRAWSTARRNVLGKDEAKRSPLARRPYDLRHAALSTWLNATNDPVRVAEWAGNTVRVLLHVYAKCLDGGEQEARRKVAERLREGGI